MYTGYFTFKVNARFRVSKSRYIFAFQWHSIGNGEYFVSKFSASFIFFDFLGQTKCNIVFVQ